MDKAADMLAPAFGGPEEPTCKQTPKKRKHDSDHERDEQYGSRAPWHDGHAVYANCTDGWPAPVRQLHTLGFTGLQTFTIEVTHLLQLDSSKCPSNTRVSHRSTSTLPQDILCP